MKWAGDGYLEEALLNSHAMTDYVRSKGDFHGFWREVAD